VSGDSAAGLIVQAERASRDQLLSTTALQNLKQTLSIALIDWEAESLSQLIAQAAWDELNDRFYTSLKFGTGGLRGRTVRPLVTDAERGDGKPGGRPDHPAVGTNCMNARNVRAATAALLRFLRTKYPSAALRIGISYDSRWFSREFAAEAAQVATVAGVDVLLFDAPASVPQLAFSVRKHEAHAGIMLTASHNPPHDNGFKVYSRDASQVIEPDASAIVAQIGVVDSVVAPLRPGEVTALDNSADAEYLAALATTIVDSTLAKRARGTLSIVYSSLHGTGIRLIPAALRSLGVEPIIVQEQASLDGAFPTVRAPNPEDPNAFAMALATAREHGALAAIATDPDSDRIGIAVRRSVSDEFTLLTGNQVSALLAEYRLSSLFNSGVLSAANAHNAAIVKTYVTTDLLDAIAREHGVRCVNTLTGFKYIGAKLRYYAGKVLGADNAWRPLSREQALEHGTYLVLGCEESYGYLSGDYVRDKDANGAALMVAELLLAANVQGTSILDLLDSLYLKHGFSTDKLETLVFEGSRGAEQIQRLLASYRSAPPERYGEARVVRVDDFSRAGTTDADGEPLPTELMLRFHLLGGGHVTLRGSGTEPKLKFYLALSATPRDAAELERMKSDAREYFAGLWQTIRDDADARLKG